MLSLVQVARGDVVHTVRLILISTMGCRGRNYLIALIKKCLFAKKDKDIDRGISSPKKKISLPVPQEQDYGADLRALARPVFVPSTIFVDDLLVN